MGSHTYKSPRNISSNKIKAAGITRHRVLSVIDKQFSVDNPWKKAALRTVAMNVDQVEYWANRWGKGDAKWHSSAPNPTLVAHREDLTGGQKSLRIFLPLCGKAGCLLHLYKAGHTVLGVEAVDSVVKEFFTDNKLQFNKSTIPEIQGSCYTSEDEKLQIFSCDLFLLTPGLLGPVDAVWDRGGFVALSPGARSKYVEQLKKLVEPSFRRYVLDGWEYDQTIKDGPPHSISVEDVKRFYGNWTHIKVLADEDVSDSDKAKTLQVDNLVKRTFLLLPKD